MYMQACTMYIHYTHILYIIFDKIQRNTSKYWWNYLPQWPTQLLWQNFLQLHLFFNAFREKLSPQTWHPRATFLFLLTVLGSDRSELISFLFWLSFFVLVNISSMLDTKLSSWLEKKFFFCSKHNVLKADIHP